MLRQLDECDTPYRRQRQVPPRVFSPSLFIQSSVRSKSIFQWQRNRNTRQGVADFDEQCIAFNKHNSLSSVFKENGESNLMFLLQSVQQQLITLDNSISTLERIQGKLAPYQGEHQLQYINQTIDTLTGRLEHVLQLGQSQKPLLTFHSNLNKFSKVYACKFCALQFSKACSLGGHISRTHKEQSLQQKLLIKKLQITKRKKQQI